MKKSKFLTISRALLVLVAYVGAWLIATYLGQEEMALVIAGCAAIHVMLFQRFNSTLGVYLLTQRRKTLFGLPLALLAIYILDVSSTLMLYQVPLTRLLPPPTARTLGYSLLFSVFIYLIDWWCLCMPARFRLSEDERREISWRRVHEALRAKEESDQEASRR